MTIKIEKKPLKANHKGGWDDFLNAVKACKVGDSFVMEHVESNHRLALSIAQRWLGANFKTAKEENGIRIGRVG